MVKSPRAVVRCKAKSKSTKKRCAAYAMRGELYCMQHSSAVRKITREKCKRLVRYKVTPDGHHFKSITKSPTARASFRACYADHSDATKRGKRASSTEKAAIRKEALQMLKEISPRSPRYKNATKARKTYYKAAADKLKRYTRKPKK